MLLREQHWGQDQVRQLLLGPLLQGVLLCGECRAGQHQWRRTLLPLLPLLEQQLLLAVVGLHVLLAASRHECRVLKQGTASTSIQIQQLSEQATMWQGQAASLPHLPLRQVSRWLAKVWMSGSSWPSAKIRQVRQPSTQVPWLPSFKAWQPIQSMTRACASGWPSPDRQKTACVSGLHTSSTSASVHGSVQPHSSSGELRMPVSPSFCSQSTLSSSMTGLAQQHIMSGAWIPLDRQMQVRSQPLTRSALPRSLHVLC